MRSLLLSLLTIFLAITVVQGQYSSIMWDKLNAVSPGLNAIGLVKVSDTKTLGSSRWSIGCETLDRNYADLQQYKSYVGELGAVSTRIQSGWAKCEPSKGSYRFGWLDTVVNDLRAQGAQPWMVLCYGNPNYGSDEKLGARIFTDQATMAGWLNYVRTTVRRYKDRIYEWEIWNEPNLGDNVKYAPAYANLLLKTVEVIKAEQPKAVIIGFALSGIPLNFTKEVFDILKNHGKANIVDYLTFHPYANNPDETKHDIDTLEKLAKSYHPGIKLFQGECGSPSILEWTHALSQYPWTEVSQAKWLLRRMANDWDRGIRSSIFTMVDLQYFNMLQSFGLLRASLEKKVIYKRPSFYAVQHMVNLFQNDTRSGGSMAFQASTYRSLTVLDVVKKEKQVGALLWYSDKIPSDALEWDRLDITIEGLNLRNPVLVNIITGKVYHLGRQLFKNIGSAVKLRELPVWDSPMLVIEKDALLLHTPEEGNKKDGHRDNLDIFSAIETRYQDKAGKYDGGPSGNHSLCAG
ncbi:MAG: beta-galactosidase [Chitinophagaceae bacterium]